MTKTEKSKKPYVLNLYSILFVIFVVCLLLNYGGFFETSIVFSALFVLILFLNKDFVLKITLPQVIFLIFSFWYLACSLRNGFVIEYTIRGTIPLVVFLFWQYVSNINRLKGKIIDIIVELSVWIAAISIIHCISESLVAGLLKRITFPFDYSNACGIYFAVCYIYADHGKEKFLARCKYVFLVALLLTQSVGALGIFTLALTYEFISRKSYISLVITGCVILVFAVIFKDRIIQSSGTFLERLLQIHDGILCMADNSIFGIGSGWWENAKHYYQTGFYTANAIHSSIIAVGVNSGIPGMLLFLAVCVLELKKLFRNKSFFLPTVMILAHSLMDFTLSFAIIGVILILSLDYPEEEKSLTVRLTYKWIFSSASIILSILLFVGIIQSNMFQKKLVQGQGGEQPYQSFKNSYYLQSSIKASRCCALILYAEKNNDVVMSFKKYKYVPVEMILHQSMSKDNKGGYLLEMLESQPYNTALRDYIVTEYDEETAALANDIVDRAARKSSIIGKFLYQMKGENK